MRVIGLDVGARRIGVASGDTETGIAAPAGVIVREDDASAVAAALREAEAREAAMIVVGMPYTMAGRVGPQAEEATAFARKLAEAGATVETMDERLSSSQAKRNLRASVPHGRGHPRSRREREAGAVDAAAAAIILQAWLDGKRGRGE